MRKQLLLSLGLASSIVGFSQKKAINESITPQRANSSERINIPQTVASSAITYNFGDTLYLNDFSDSTTFTKTTAPSTVGFWVFGTDATIGSGFFGNTVFASTTAANGYAMFDSDGFGQNAFNDAAITVGPIDLSAATAPITVNFEQYYSRFADSAQVLLSTDGINFTLIGDNMDVPQQTQGGGGPTDNPDLRTYLINEFAGQSTVFVRFRFKGNWDYSWLVDDLTITEVSIPEADVALAKIWHNDIFVLYEQEITPLSQVDTVRVGTVIENNGSLSQSVEVAYSIKRAGVEVNSGSYTIDNIASFTSDTTYFNSSYVPTEAGTYALEVTISLAGDVSTDNNFVGKSFQISDFIYSAIEPSAAGMLTFSYSGAGTGTPLEFISYKVGSSFIINNEIELYGFNIAVPRATNNQPMDIGIELFSTGSWNSPIAIGEFTVSATHPNTFNSNSVIIRPFDSPVALPQGEYSLFITYLDTDRQFRFFGKDTDDDLSSFLNGPFGCLLYTSDAADE